MTDTPFRAIKNRQAKKYCVKYRPTDPQSRPSFGTLWRALASYDSAVLGETTALTVETAYRTLKGAAMDAKAQYPRIGLTILEDDREMFPANA